MCRYPIYCSRIKLAIAVSTAVAALLASQVDIFLNHLIDLQTQLLIDFSPDDFCVDKKGHQETNSHH